MKEIKLTQNKVALVDDEDFVYLSKLKWHSYKDRNTFYARHTTARIDGQQKTILMHRLIMNADKGVKIDHKTGNGLDNTRQNLRLATSAQNGQNRQSAKGKSRFKGVHFDNAQQKWAVQIGLLPKKRKFLGRFVDEIQAAKAYDKAAIEHFGEFAKLNFPSKEAGFTLPDGK